MALRATPDDESLGLLPDSAHIGVSASHEESVTYEWLSRQFQRGTFRCTDQLGNPPTDLDLSTTDTFSGSILVCFNYSSVSYTDPSKLQLFHYTGGSWVSITVSNNATTRVICGNTSSLWPFVVFESRYSATVQPPLSPNSSNVLNGSRGAIPVKFSLTIDGNPTCQLPPATIAVTRTAGTPSGPVTGTLGLPSENGAKFRISDCQYIFNLDGKALAPLPPGLAKRGGNLPPGLQKQLRRNGQLPPGLQKQVNPFPVDLERRLPTLPQSTNVAPSVIKQSSMTKADGHYRYHPNTDRSTPLEIRVDGAIVACEAALDAQPVIGALTRLVLSPSLKEAQ